jgi:hypothetical protein
MWCPAQLISGGAAIAKIKKNYILRELDIETSYKNTLIEKKNRGAPVINTTHHAFSQVLSSSLISLISNKLVQARFPKYD